MKSTHEENVIYKHYYLIVANEIYYKGSFAFANQKFCEIKVMKWNKTKYVS